MPCWLFWTAFLFSRLFSEKFLSRSRFQVIRRRGPSWAKSEYKILVAVVFRCNVPLGSSWYGPGMASYQKQPQGWIILIFTIPKDLKKFGLKFSSYLQPMQGSFT